VRKLILGIAAVFCAQIAFQLFVAIDDYRARYYSVQLAGPVADEPIEVAAVSDDGAIEQVSEISSGPDKARTVSPRPVRRNIASQRITFTPVRTSSIARFDTTVIVIPKPAQTERAPLLTSREPGNAYAVTTKVISRPRKRSFFAKALPILKKPYEMLKLVGSKLN